MKRENFLKLRYFFRMCCFLHSLCSNVKALSLMNRFQTHKSSYDLRTLFLAPRQNAKNGMLSLAATGTRLLNLFIFSYREFTKADFKSQIADDILYYFNKHLESLKIINSKA